MLTIEEFITQKKKNDKLDEFNFQKHTENMTAVIHYVMEYFNEYLDPVTFDYERIKTEQAAEKIRADIVGKYPQSVDAIIDFYKKTKQRLDKLMDKSMRSIDDIELFYCDEDYQYVVSNFCKGRTDCDSSEAFSQSLKVLAKELKQAMTSPPDMSEMKQLDNNIIDWVKETYHVYGVNLLEYSDSITYELSDKYIECVYDKSSETFFHINSYDYRYQENPFDINRIYERNKHRPFLQDHKGELEMIIMRIWLFDEVKDTDYWAEYVNLCASTGHVNLVRHLNVLTPVNFEKLSYPPEITSSISFLATTDGVIMTDPRKPYILRINHKDNRDTIWTDKSEIDRTIDNLHRTFWNYGPPEVLELLSPYRDSQFNESHFFDQYSQFEKSMQKYKSMKIAIVNGSAQNKNQREFMIKTIEDIAKIRSICKEMKFKLKLSIDFSEANRRSPLREDSDKVFSYLSTMRSDVICVHVNTIDGSSYSNKRYDRDDDNSLKVYINKNDYAGNSDFLAGLSMFMRDSTPRFFIPDKVKSSGQLEAVVDMLLRGGFYFNSKEDLHER